MIAEPPAFDQTSFPLKSPTVGGLVSGGVRTTLRLEGLAALLVAFTLYFHSGHSLGLFAVLFLAPDLSMIAYLAGPRAGAAVYNVAHTYALALPLALYGWVTQPNSIM